MTIITFEEFETLCQSGQIYTGLVRGVGWVSWTSSPVYFVKIKEKFKAIHYRQISYYDTIVCRNNGYEVVTKTQYRLLITPPDALEYSNPSAYKEFYPIPPLKQDAIKDYTKDAIRISEDRRNSKSGTKEALEMGAKINDAVGLPLGIARGLNDNKLLGKLGWGLTGITIINNITEGEYITASGELLKAFSGWYGVVWDIGVTIYESESFIIQQYWQAEANYIYRAKELKQSNNIITRNNFKSAESYLKDRKYHYRKLMKEKYGK